MHTGLLAPYPNPDELYLHQLGQGGMGVKRVVGGGKGMFSEQRKVD